MKDAENIGPGTEVGPYTLSEQIGRGASATVWLAHDGHGEAVAVKVRRRGQASMDRRFLREFESMRALRIPGVVRVLEAGIDEHLLWFSMDLVWGRPFTEVIQEGKLPEVRVEAAIALSKQLFEIMADLHEAGFVHRDVKPSNVLVDKAGKVHVLDFGIGRFYGDTDTTLSHSGEVLGTVPYMAPEQIAGLPIDGRVDLFASGLMVYEGIAGKRPRPSTTIGWIPIICLDRLVPLACRIREVSLGLSKLVERLTAVDPGDRPTARDCVRILRRIETGEDAYEWPEPRFVNRGEWWAALEGAIGTPEHAKVWILEGDAGSGRTRVTEQLHRLALMQGIWPIHVRCRTDLIGDPMAGLLETLLNASDDEAWQRHVAGEDPDALRRMWPHLNLPGQAAAGSDIPTSSEITDAFGHTVRRAADKRPLLLMVHDVEQVDALTARGLLKLGLQCGRNLGMVLIHEKRWGTRTSRTLCAHMQARHSAGKLPVPPLEPSEASEIAAELCPEAPPEVSGITHAQMAVEAGLKALAAWRGQAWEPPPDHLGLLAVRPIPIPGNVLQAVNASPELLTSKWVVETETGLTLRGRTAARAAATRLVDPRGSAGALARAWSERHPPWGALAGLWLLAQAPMDAWFPAAKAALEAENLGNYQDARRWLLVLDTLPEDRPSATRLEFNLAYARARVALRTEGGAPRLPLVDVCEGLATTAVQEQLARILRVQYQLRRGEVRPALVAALRLSSPQRQPSPEAAVRALLVAVTCRTALGQLTEAERELDRARTILDEHPMPVLEVQHRNWTAEVAFRKNQLDLSRKLCLEAIVAASQVGRVRGVAFASSRLGKVLRMLGKRREAEHQTRSAREAFSSTGDLGLDAETGLALATLLAERGDAAGARHLLDDTVRRMRSLNLDHLMPTAMRVALQIATLRADTADAAMALTTLEQGRQDPETPAVLVRWWRTRGDVDRALMVEGPTEDSYYGQALWKLERARVALVGGLSDLTREEAQAGMALAEDSGFAELHTYGRLLSGVVDRPGDWADIVREAAGSQSTELFLGALEMEARALVGDNDEIGARRKWRTLRARAKELGYRPAVEEAEGWLADN